MGVLPKTDVQYPYRTKTAWSSHFRREKDRIIAIAKRHAATQAAANPEPEDLDPTYSDRSPSPIASGSQSKPKKQKVAVSKKDYEDLARFIVDNIAEGDVPDTKDFAAFSKDVSHHQACIG
jgi:anthranilate/para-aminobenzoate synthase component I